jgi:hypothetical protein
VRLRIVEFNTQHLEYNLTSPCPISVVVRSASATLHFSCGHPKPLLRRLYVEWVIAGFGVYAPGPRRMR